MLTEDDEEGGFEVSNKTLRLLLLGITLVFVGIIVIVASSLIFGGSGSLGGVILIGPIPIVFGAGPESGLLIVLGIVITIVSVVSFWIMNKRFKRKDD